MVPFAGEVRELIEQANEEQVAEPPSDEQQARRYKWYYQVAHWGPATVRQLVADMPLDDWDRNWISNAIIEAEQLVGDELAAFHEWFSTRKIAAHHDAAPAADHAEQPGLAGRAVRQELNDA